MEKGYGFKQEIGNDSPFPYQQRKIWH
jgi:hypothetical protein